MSRRNRVRVRHAGWLACLVLGPAAHAASFDCAKASTATEKLICNTQRISDLDEYLGRYYLTARADVGRGASCLASNQRAWLREVRNVCTDARCLERVYLARLAELDPLQLGANALKNEELPDVKALAWVIAPEPDRTAAPPPKGHEPLVVRGSIVDDADGGNGFLIVDAAGTRVSLLPAMFLDKPNYNSLAELARDREHVYEAQGISEPTGDGHVYFAPGACRYVYRLPKQATSNRGSKP